MSRNRDFNSKEFVSGFLSTYKELPVLWDPHQESYKEKEATAEGYSQLLNFMRMHSEKPVSLSDVKSKIQSLRAAHRKELNKVKASGGTHKPKLWFFPLMSFIEASNPKSTKEWEEFKLNEINFDTSYESVDNEQTKPELFKFGDEDESLYEKKKRRKKKLLEKIRSSEEKGKMAMVWVPRIERPQDALVDDCDVVGVNIANKLRKMDPVQRILAEDMMNRILTKGLMGELNSQSESVKDELE